jgi:hypothetical protein
LVGKPEVVLSSEGFAVTARTVGDGIAARRWLFYIVNMPPVLCSQCDKTESECKCNRYCCTCGGQEGIRLCMDGLYYCPDCREACEMSPASMIGP